MVLSLESQMAVCTSVRAVGRMCLYVSSHGVLSGVGFGTYRTRKCRRSVHMCHFVSYKFVLSGVCFGTPVTLISSGIRTYMGQDNICHQGL